MKQVIKYGLILISLLVFIVDGKCQQMPVYSQYTMNYFLINPAIAGSDGYTSINLTAHEQWIGFPGSPKTHALSAQTRVLRNSFISRGNKVKKRGKYGSRSGRVGLGGYVYNDHLGLIDRTGMQLAYAYHIKMDDTQLSFGLSMNAYQFRINYNDIEAPQEDMDPLIEAARRNVFIPDANFGAYYATQDYYVGFSASDLLQSSLKLPGSNVTGYKIQRTYSLMGGYKFSLGKTVKRRPSKKYEIELEPNMLLKLSEFGAMQLDLGTKVHIGEDYWAGLNYRTKNSLIVFGGLKIDKFYIGYAFDYSFSDIMRHTYGSHEISAAMKRGENVRRYRWLNPF
jgi:type IX secretion system PorP/SprF family membrane protein